MGHDILIDGYNVIKNNPMFQLAESKSQAGARDILIKQLKNRYYHSTYRVVVVFDGNGKAEQMYHEDHICIIFSRYGETADSVIARLTAESRRKGTEVLLFSDDGEVKQNVQTQGGKTQTTRQLTNKLNAAPWDVAVRAQHRQEMKRIYGIDPSYKPEDDYDSPCTHKRRKRKKSSRR